MKIHSLILVTLLGTLNCELDLSQWTRSGKQFGGNEEGGVALGLVSALQKWANSLESQTSTLRSEVLGLKNSNIQLMEEMQQVKSQNINLKNEVSQANERTMNLKNIYQKSSEQFDELKKENIELKTLIQQHETVLKTQQEKIQNNNNEINSLKTELSSTSASLTSLQGKTETFSMTVTDKFVEIQPILQNLSVSVHDLSKNTSSFQSSLSQKVNEMAQTVTNNDIKHTQISKDIKNELSQKDRENMEVLKEVASNLEKSIRSDIKKWERTTQNLKTQTLSSVSTLNVEVESLGKKMAEHRNAIELFDQFKSEARNNLDMIKLEINKSVDVLSRALDKNVSDTFEQVTREVKKLEDKSEYVSDSLLHVTKDVERLNTQSTKNFNEINKLKTGTQRSVDASSGLRLNLSKMEGKLSEVMKSNSLLNNQIEKINVTLAEDQSRQMNTVKGLERLGDSISSLKGEMMGNKHDGTLKILKEKSDKIEKQVKSLTADQLATVQDITRNTGRLNKVELDIKKMGSKVVDIESEQQKEGGKLEADVVNVKKLAGEIRSDVDTIATTLTTTRNALAEVLTKMSSLEAQGTASRSSSDVDSTVRTLKTNVIGLGNYINSINREVNSLAGRTKDSIENLNQQVVELTANVNSIEAELDSTKKTNDNLKNEFSSGDFVASTLRTDVAGLSTKLYTLKTSVFEMTSELSGVKSGIQSLNSDVKGINTSIQNLSNKILTNEQSSKTTKSDLTTLRSGLSGLTNSIFAVKTQIKSIETIDDKLDELSRNVTGVSDVVAVTRNEFSKIKPEVDLIATDITTIRNGMSRMTKAVQSISNPPRFSCGVTGDEIKVSGVITYDECNVNSEKMMNAGTGHATVPIDGDYMLSFTANMVSSNSQAIWCALYKQSPGDEGWQVLGMINNYQRDAGDEDDRDSGSLSILATLKEGDQVWVEWRGYGESFLYSNPYKLISFTGYMVTSTS